MRGQTPLIIFVLLLLISLLLMLSAVSWGSAVASQNLDIGRVSTAENFIRALDSAIQSIYRHGGAVSLDYPLAATISLDEVADIIEIRMPVTAGLPEHWVNLTEPDGLSLIRTRREGTEFRLQLSYPPRACWVLDIWTDGAQVAVPRSIWVEQVAIESIADCQITQLLVRFE